MKPVRMLLAAGLLFLLVCAGRAFAHGGLVDLSIYDRTEARRLPVHWHEGRAYVVGRPGNEYQITLRNRRSGEELLAVVSVDGVNVITGQTADYSQSGYVVGSRSGMDIQGWRRNLGQTAAFYFTSLPDSYAARTGRPDNVGVIGVAVFRRKQAPPPAPIGGLESHSDSAPAARSMPAEPQLGTGHGRHETSPARYVSFERATSSPAEVVTLYYNSRESLVAKGVIRDPVPVAPYRRPTPFPGFVPDPA